MIRNHGDEVEADLAFRGLDLRDLWRPGSGMSLRRLLVLVKALPPDSLTHLALEADRQKALKPSIEKLRERQAFWDAKKKEAVTGD